jgi:hypothetical protein
MASAVLAAAVVIAAAGCTGVSKRDREALDAAVAAVAPDRVGTVVRETRGGGSHGPSASPSRTVVVTSGDSADALSSRASARLESAGFVRTGSVGWRGSAKGKTVTVFATPASGGSVLVGKERVTIDVGQSALVLRFVVA